MRQRCRNVIDHTIDKIFLLRVATHVAERKDGNRRQLVYVTKALEIEREKIRRYENASPLERRIIEIEERYGKQYQDAVNALPRGNGTREGMLQFRKEVKILQEKYNRLRDTEIEKIKSDS